MVIISEGHSSAKIRDLRPSKAVTFLYIGTCVLDKPQCEVGIYIFFVKTSVVELLTRNIM